MRRAALLVLLVLLGACTSSDPRPRAKASAEPPRSTRPADPCAGYPPPFEPSYLPDGFDPELRRGAGLFEGAGEAGAGYPTAGLLGHYRDRDAETVHVNFEVRPGPLPYEPANPKPLRVLGERGRIGTIEGGFAVEFSLGDCSFRMDTYGVSRADTVAVATGLRKRR